MPGGMPKTPDTPISSNSIDARVSPPSTGQSEPAPHPVSHFSHTVSTDPKVPPIHNQLSHSQSSSLFVLVMMLVLFPLTLIIVAAALQTAQTPSTSYPSHLQQSLTHTSQSLPQCPDTRQIPSTTNTGTPWTCNLSFSSSTSYESCMKEWEGRLRTYLEQSKGALCTLPDFDDRINETELLASDSPPSTSYQSTVEGHISNAPCGSPISDIKVLTLEGNLVLVEAANGALYQQLIKRFLQLASLVIQRQQQCQPSQPPTQHPVSPQTPQRHMP